MKNMKPVIKLSIFVILILSLFGCGSIYQTIYSYQPPQTQEGKVCVSQCMQIKKTCQHICLLQDRNCRLTEHQAAYYRYTQYQASRTAHGLPVERHINDFDQSYSKCFQSCSCEVGFNQCYQKCGGTISEHKECTAFCD